MICFGLRELFAKKTGPIRPHTGDGKSKVAFFVKTANLRLFALWRLDRWPYDKSEDSPQKEPEREIELPRVATQPRSRVGGEGGDGGSV